MNKGIIVLDVPERCRDCIAFRNDDDYGNYCMKSIRFLENFETRPDWCEIRELPEYRPEVITHGSFGMFPGDFGGSVEAKGRIIKENIGYNECLDDILGSERK